MDGSNIPELLSKYARNAIGDKAHSLNLRSPRTWTPEEDEILRAKVKYGYNIEELLIRHTAEAIRTRAVKFGLTYTEDKIEGIPWTKEEIDLLYREYPENGTAIPGLSGRKPHQIRRKANKLGISTKKNNKVWPEEDKQILYEQYPRVGSNIPQLLTRYS